MLCARGALWSQRCEALVEQTLSGVCVPDQRHPRKPRAQVDLALTNDRTSLRAAFNRTRELFLQQRLAPADVDTRDRKHSADRISPHVTTCGMPRLSSRPCQARQMESRGRLSPMVSGLYF
eukprot:5652529-Pleurochrysis_carterae.AAC.1